MSIKDEHTGPSGVNLDMANSTRLFKLQRKIFLGLLLTMLVLCGLAEPRDLGAMEANSFCLDVIW